ncbi:hypothetical protein [Rhodococcus sp. NPDC058521]|uniref:hypothetical protein n=1 Tax=Rhodococcus sp. NPDC058521 TaxID=3346536 RepID=UPI00364F9472
MTHRRTAAGCALAVFAALVSGCASVIDGSPRVVGEGPPIHGEPVSSLDRAEWESADATRMIDPCLALDPVPLDGFGDVIAHGPVGDLSTCRAEIVPPGGSSETPAWVEVNIGVLEPSAELGAAEEIAGKQVRGSAVTLPGSCALYFPLAPYLALGQQLPDTSERWGYVSYLDSGASDCVAARRVTASVLGKLERGETVAGARGIPLAQQDPCRVVEELHGRVETFGPGSRPFECRIGLKGAVSASVAFSLTPPPETRDNGLDEVVLGDRRFMHFQDAMACNYYFYPGEVVETGRPDEDVLPLTAAVTASAANCEDAEVVASVAAAMFDY